MSSKVISGWVGLGQVKSSKVKSSQVKSGLIRSGQVSMSSQGFGFRPLVMLCILLYLMEF